MPWNAAAVWAVVRRRRSVRGATVQNCDWYCCRVDSVHQCTILTDEMRNTRGVWANQTWETCRETRALQPTAVSDLSSNLRMTLTRIMTGPGVSGGISSPAACCDLRTRDHRWTRASITTKAICCIWDRCCVILDRCCSFTQQGAGIVLQHQGARQPLAAEIDSCAHSARRSTLYTGIPPCEPQL